MSDRPSSERMEWATDGLQHFCPYCETPHEEPTDDCCSGTMLVAAEGRIAALEAERDELEAYLMEALNQLDDFKLALVDCLKSRRHQLRERDRLREIVDMAWKGWGYDQEWDCDCPVCAAIRTRTPHALEGGDDA